MEHELEAYAARLTAEWDTLARALWPLRAVEDMARATAIVFWARSHGVAIDPLILTLPPRAGDTPAYAPIIGTLSDQGFGATGGVALTPEDKRTASGRLFLNTVRATVLAESQQDQHPVLVTTLVVLGYWALGLGFTLACAILFWIACRFLVSRRVSLRRAVQVWLLACIADLALAIITGPLVSESGPLGLFDADMLAFLVTVCAFPCLAFALLSRVLRGEPSAAAADRGWPLRRALRRAPVTRLLLLAITLLGPICNTLLGVAVAMTTAAIAPPVPGPALNAVLNHELAPADVWSQALFTVVTPTAAPSGSRTDAAQPRLLLLPRSLVHAQRRLFETMSRFPAKHPPELTHQDISGDDPALPFTVLRRITWPDGMPLPDGVTHYSVDGAPPFEARPPAGSREEPIPAPAR